MAAPVLIAAVAAAGLVVLYFVGSILSTARTPGLVSIPNAHWSVPYSGLWLLWQQGTANENNARFQAHAKGPVIRIGPKELSINCIDGGVKTVYDGNWEKSKFYELFENYGQNPLVALIKGPQHAERKRMIAHVYSKTFVDNSKDLAEIIKTVKQDRLSPLLRTWADNKVSVNVLPLVESYNMDVVTAYIYGLANGTNWLQNQEEAKVFLDAFEASLSSDTFFLAAFPFLTVLLSHIGINLVPARVYDAFPTYQGLGLTLSDRTKKSLGTSQSAGLGMAPIVYQQFRKKLEETSVPEESLEKIVASEMLDHVHAAHQASGIVVTYLMWELSKNKSVQEQLSKELRAMKSAGEDPEKSPLLDDILTETMRLHPAAWGPFPRVTPLAGAKLGEFENIPYGVTVSASPYTLGRNPEVFPDPESWKPQRWSGLDSETRKQMDRWVWLFGSGSRICIGKHVAIKAIKSITVSIYEGYRTTIERESDMTHDDAMMALPKDRELTLRFFQL